MMMTEMKEEVLSPPLQHHHQMEEGGGGDVHHSSGPSSSSSLYPPANVWFKAHYRMFGNAVCPPVVCAIAGAMLEHMEQQKIDGADGGTPCPVATAGAEAGVGLSAAVQVALGAVAPRRRDAVLQWLKRNGIVDGDQMMLKNKEELTGVPASC